MVSAQLADVVVVVSGAVVLVDDAGDVVVVVAGVVPSLVLFGGVVVDVPVDCRSLVVVGLWTLVDVLLNSGAETFRGEAGRWFTCASAASTICQVTTVVKTSTRVHPVIKEIKRTHQFSHRRHRVPVNGFLRFRQGGR